MMYKKNKINIAIILFQIIVILSPTANALTKVPAGTIIGNAATATYYDENNNQYTTTSNVVQTVVQAVCGIDILPDEDVQKDGVPGETVYLPFQIVNTGNSENTFSLQIQNGSYQKSIYLDKNQNGVIDPGEQTVSSLTLGMDEIANIIVVVSIPASANSGDTDSFSIVATATNVGSCSDSGNINVNVLNDAIIQTNKSVDKSKASPGEIITYTISFKNTGTKDALSIDGFTIDNDSGVEGILVSDRIPDGTAYVTGSASGNPTSNPNGFVVYSSDGTNWFKNETDVIGDIKYVGFFMPDNDPTNDSTEPVLAPDQQGILTFRVRINNPYNGNKNYIDNRASISYKTTGGISKIVNTNETHTEIPVSEQVDISVGALNDPEEDSGDNWDNDNIAENVPAGSWVIFKHTAKNNGNLDDVINLKVDSANTSLPQNAIVEFWNGSASAKLIDTDGDGNVDLGTVEKNNERDFIVKVFIPPDTPSKSKDGNVDYYVTIMGISHNKPSEIDRSKDNIDGIIGASVDIGKWNTVGDSKNDTSDNDTDGSNDSDDILPSDNGKELKIITTQEKCSVIVKNIVNPGEKAVYPIEILNRGGYSDSFSLGAKQYVGTVKFYIDENCDGVKDREITNTPTLGGTVLSQNAAVGNSTVYVEDVSNFNAGDIVYIDDERKEIKSVDINEKKIVLKSSLSKPHSKGTFVSEAAFVIMEISIPKTEKSAEHNIIVTAKSNNSNAQDSIDAYLKIKNVNKLVIVPDGSDQLPPGGTTTYQHIITNKGNSTINAKITVPTNTKLTYIILDNNNNPQGTSFVLPSSLKPDESYTVYIKAIAPSDIQPGTVETVEIKVVDRDNDQILYDSAQDTTTVIEGFMQLLKTADKTEVKPGEVVTYKIKYKNIGDKNAINVVITDNIPNYTSYELNTLCLDTNCDGVCDKNLTDVSGDDEGEFDNDSNVVRFRVGSGANATQGGTVKPGEEGCVIFKVKIKE